MEQDQSKTETPAAVRSSDGLDPLRDQVRVQGEHGNWNCNDYMLGMFNGLECALATLEKRDPQYRRKPDEGWLDDRIPPGFVPTVADGSNHDSATPVADPSHDLH